MLRKRSLCLTAAMLAILLVVTAAFAQDAPSVEAAPQGAADIDGWRFGFELYGLFPAIGGELATGQDFDVGFNDILDNLNFALMGMAGAFKGRWSLVADVLYMDVGGDDSTTLTLPLTSNLKVTEDVKADLTMQSWVVAPTVGYDLFTNDKIQFTLIGGARYLWIKTRLKVSGSNSSKYRENKVTDSQGNWDVIAGVRGRVLLTKKWFLPFYADIGTGDSDLTWQLMGGVGYRFDRFDLVAGYRYMAWDFGGDYIIENIDISGPMVGMRFMF